MLLVFYFPNNFESGVNLSKPHTDLGNTGLSKNRHPNWSTPKEGQKAFLSSSHKDIFYLKFDTEITVTQSITGIK